jgi:spore maturation protein CgeB
MKLVIFGLSISSSWGNGHATLWRGLCRALARRSHRVVFFERDVAYYARHRDQTEIAGCELILYPTWADALRVAEPHLRDADAAMVTSYCPDGIEATELILGSRVPLKTFYDLDAPVTLDHLRRGDSVSYIGPGGLAGFDVVLSYTGGAALSGLKRLLGARRVEPLYGSVDPAVHYPVDASERYRCDLSYLGTYADDRQAGVDTLLIEPARRMPDMKFLIGGSMYPDSFPWTRNIHFFPHVPPGEHPAFYCSSRLTLNVTRRAMAEMGYCPSGRLFEAAACGTPIISDEWEGLDNFFEPGLEIIIARTTEHVLDAMAMGPDNLARIARKAREHVLESHTADHRAAELEAIFETAHSIPATEVAVAASGVDPLAKE